MKQTLLTLLTAFALVCAAPAANALCPSTVDSGILASDAARCADGSLRAPNSGDAVPLSCEGNELRCRGILLGDTTYLPLRAFCNTFGCSDVRWDEAAKTASVTIDGDTLTATEGTGALEYRGRVLYSGRETVNRDGTLYVPCRPLCKALGLSVTWDNRSRSVALTKGSGCASAANYYDADELYWLAHIINAEAGIEPFLGQIAVGNVVLNRVRASGTPNTVYGVIFDRTCGVQFTPAYSPSDSPAVYETPDADAWRAAKICLEGYSLSDDALYFYAPQYVYAAWIENNCAYCFTIAGHRFFA